MAHIITSLCMRDNDSSDVCPMECIHAGAPIEQSQLITSIRPRVSTLAPAFRNVTAPPYSPQTPLPLRTRPKVVSS